MALVESPIKFVLTVEGYKALAQGGLENNIIYYTFFDDGVNYTLNAYPTLITDISGDKDIKSPANELRFKLKTKV